MPQREAAPTPVWQGQQPAGKAAWGGDSRATAKRKNNAPCPPD